MTAVSFGSNNATLAYSGLAGNFVGLYEFYITVPPSLANGRLPDQRDAERDQGAANNVPDGAQLD